VAQYLKDAVQARITTGALEVFARRGFRKATMAEIAAAAGVSTGNIYRYYRNKVSLFDVVVSDEFVSTFTRLLRLRVKAFDGIADAGEPRPGEAYRAASEILLAFAIDDRLRLVVLLGRSEGTRLEGFASRIISELQRQALAYARRRRPALKVTPGLRFTLGQIYRNWIGTLVTVLEEFETEAEIREIVDSVSSYHLAGLRGLLT